MEQLDTIFERIQNGDPIDFEPGAQLEVIQGIRQGLSWQVFEQTARMLDMTQETAAQAIRVPLRTLARRKNRRLVTQESERLYRLIRVAARAKEVLGSMDKAKSWMQSPNRALSGEAPLSLIDTDIGTRAVLDVLGRIDHGVYS